MTQAVCIFGLPLLLYVKTKMQTTCKLISAEFSFSCLENELWQVENLEMLTLLLKVLKWLVHRTPSLKIIKPRFVPFSLVFGYLLPKVNLESKIRVSEQRKIPI